MQVLGLITKWAMNYSLRESDGLIVTSSRLGTSLQKRFEGHGKSTNKPISVIRNVFPPEINQHASEREERSIAGLNLLYAGTLGRAGCVP